jgi:hypothetical protein
MSEFTNRLGQDNFIWWTGVVEDRNDPLNLGRFKCRIFGWHTENLNEIPTKDLPWAMPLLGTNNSKNFSTPMEGDYVMGFFTDGMAGQSPVVMGVLPGIPQSAPTTGKGFSALAKMHNNPDVIKLKEEKPAAPNTAPAQEMQKPGKPTTPANAYTANGTMLSVTNSNLTHACDFKFLINFTDLNIGVIQNPITLIEQAIAESKNKAAAIMRAAIAKIVDDFRLVIDGIIITLNLDPSGEIAKAVSTARYYVRQINYYSKKIAEFIGAAALVISLIKELKQIIEWIKSLPAKILALLKDCLATFTKGVTDATSQITAIPGQVSSSLATAFTELQTSAESTVAAIEEQVVEANVPNTIIVLVTSPADANLTDVELYFTDTYANSNVILDQASTASFNIANTSTP